MEANRPQLFWAMLVSMGIAALSVIAVVLARGEPGVWVYVAIFAFAAVMTESAPIKVHSESWVSLTVVVIFMAIPVAGMPAAVAGALGAGVVAGLSSTRARIVKAVYNASMFILAAAFASAVFGAIVGMSPLALNPQFAIRDGSSLTLGLLLAGITYSAVNGVLMAAAVHSTSGLPFIQTVRQFAREILLLQAVYVGISAIAYTLWTKVHVFSLILLIVPLLVARRSLLSVQKRQEAFDRMVGAFVETIQAKDGYTRGHAERVSELSVRVAERMGLSYEDRELIRYGAILHDVGKVGVSLGILCKAGPLTDDEFDDMKRHPDIGADILEDIDFLQPALAIVRHHHERMDGRGYPAGLASDEIPLLTRVVTAVDAFDAMTSTRSYRRALPVEVAMEELQNNAGTQFDAEVVGHLVAVIEQDGWTVTDEPATVLPPVPAARS